MDTSTSSLSSSHEPSHLTPIYPVFSGHPGIGAAYTGKGTSTTNAHFSFRASSDCTSSNLQQLASQQGFSPTTVAWPNGAWPHSGNAIKAEDYLWTAHPRGVGIVPSTHDGQAVTYDGIATRSKDFVLGVQGADCPSVFLYSSRGGVIGLAHLGWRPVVRGVIEKTLKHMSDLGAERADIIAYIAPGIGDRHNLFQWDEGMGQEYRDVFLQAGREDLLSDREVRHKLTDEDSDELRAALGRDVEGGVAFMLSRVIMAELVRCDVLGSNIARNTHSTICERYAREEADGPVAFRYHSYRRDGGDDPKRPGHGLGMSTIFLK